jgi:UDP-N-acetylmuramoyl-L-alanyl-D-glutamate--2,6-diaminopimelate ligase
VLLRDLVRSAGDALASARLDDSAGAVEVSDVTHDSRRVQQGSLFCCVRGERSDGHRYAGDAVRAGASALLCERRVRFSVPQLVVPDSRQAMAHAAAAFHGHPSRALQTFGVTGTNGKTTTVHLLASILRASGIATGVIGTLTGARTTPESTDLQGQLAVMRERGERAVAMEVSSHALVQQRVEATSFTAVAFTNLSRDHLDFHGTMEAYFKAKAGLFTSRFAPIAVIDVDNPYGRLLADTSDVPTVVRVSASQIEVVELGLGGSRFRWRDHDVELPLAGRFNISNALVAAELALAVGVAPGDIARGLAAAPVVPGRFERVEAGQPYTIVVDYAHTPEGLERVLASAREVVGGAGRVLVLFGCGGDRDVTKRPHMARAAEEGADLVTVTSDNPRHEEPLAIIDEVVAGFARRPWLVEADRRQAIAATLAEARRGDIVVIAGKGHETTQEVGGRMEPFDDRQVAAHEARRLLGAAR